MEAVPGLCSPCSVMLMRGGLGAGESTQERLGTVCEPDPHNSPAFLSTSLKELQG